MVSTGEELTALLAMPAAPARDPRSSSSAPRSARSRGGNTASASSRRSRIDGGVKVWRRHPRELASISARTGVPAEYLVAITGVETFYGRITGRYRVLDSLATLGFDYPPRSEFFRKELEQFLLMAREEMLDPREPLGSYAGAMGIPQFMPSSFRRFAVDGSGDGHRNLWQVRPRCVRQRRQLLQGARLARRGARAGRGLQPERSG